MTISIDSAFSGAVVFMLTTPAGKGSVALFSLRRTPDDAATMETEGDLIFVMLSIYLLFCKG